MRRLAAGVLFLLGSLTFPSLLTGAKQVRVIVDRAAIFAEPSRSSTRVDVVEKGTLLDLFQQKKVRNVWYYVTFSSPRLGAKISGFIHESSVEPVDEAKALPSKGKDIRATEPARIVLPPEQQAPQPPPEPKPPAPVMPQPEKVEPKPAAETRAEPTEVLIPTALLKYRSIKFPRREPVLRELAWTPPQPVEAPKEMKTADVEKPIPPPPAPKPEEKALKPAVSPRAKEKEKPADLVPPQAELPSEKKTAEPPAKKDEKPRAPAPSPSAAVRPARVKPPKATVPGKKPGVVSFGLGYGPSFGGAGGSLELRVKSGFAVHAGFGLYPTTLIYSETEWVKNRALFSAGVKYYLPWKSPRFSPYIDLQYGGQRIEAAQVVIGIWEYSYVFSREQKSLFGPSLLGGTEVRLGRFGIDAALGMSYSLTDWKFLANKAVFSFDLGLFFHF